jgi:MarR family transcriptional regulator, organic hydroperoxide resistance regulator
MSSISSITKRKQAKERQERLELARQLQFLGQMASTETALFHQMAAAKNGLSITDSKTISTLMQEGPMTAGELASRLSLTTGAVTSVIDRLSAAGYVGRGSDPDDRRKVIVHVNHKKIVPMGKTYDSIGRAFQKILQNYTAAELKFLVEYYKTSIELTKAEILKLHDKA